MTKGLSLCQLEIKHHHLHTKIYSETLDDNPLITTQFTLKFIMNILAVTIQKNMYYIFLFIQWNAYFEIQWDLFIQASV